MQTTLTHSPGPEVEKARADLKKANARLVARYPGEPSERQPVHTLYGGAHLFSSQIVQKARDGALRALEEYAPDPETLALALSGGKATDLSLWKKVYPRICEKIQREPLEDFRIDFEDGYGNRSDVEEDGHVQAAALEVAKGLNAGSLPPFIGIRVKSLSGEYVDRALRTLDGFLTTLVNETKGKLPSNFVVTIPKVTHREQTRMVRIFLEAIELKLKLPENSLKFEIMVETTQSVLDDYGVCPLRGMVDEGGGRCISAHFGTYDYTAGSRITAAYQSMSHPVCDFAKHVMKVALTGTGVTLSDGATNVMPIGPHRESPGSKLTEQQKRENREVVHRAWKLSYEHIRHSLVNGFYQGWDLHPSQIPVRFATVYSFFLESLDPMTDRLRTFVEKAARATLLGDVFDDAATGQGLLNFFLSGMSCGAITEQEALATGLSLQEIQTRSFLRILKGRSKI